MASPRRAPSPAPTPGRDDDQPNSWPAEPSPEPEHAGGQQAGSDPGEVDAIVEKLEDRLRWVTADLENLRRRYDREIIRERLAERSQVAREWLPVIDNLDLALQHVDQSADAPNRAVIAGVGAVRDQAVAVLERLGFSRYDDVGKPFDPARHEAVSTIESDAPDKTIVAAVRAGYGNGDEVLRPAGVVVSRSSAPRVGEAGSGATGRPESREPR
jgi:molecular chaperone GrpE